MIRRGIRPRARPALDWPSGGDDFRRVFPFRKSWVAIAVLLALDAVFIVPAIGVYRQAADSWVRGDSLTDFVGAAFSSAWLLGWSAAPALITAILVFLLFGREVIRVRRGRIRLFFGLPLFGIAADYDPARMRNPRFQMPPPKSGRSWRGGHIAFDYGANQGEFGSGLDAAMAAALLSQIEITAGTRLRRGQAAPDELDGDWEPADSGRFEAAESPAAPPPAPLPLSAVLLISANLVPVFGTLFLGWRLSDVMVLYWAESAVIGFFNLGKIIVVGKWMALLAGPFFVGHFGGFMAVHFLFIYHLFVAGPGSSPDDEVREVVRLFATLWPALLALFVSHGYSFFANFIGRREYLGRSVQKQMGEPYTRIVFMHLTLIFGGFAILLIGDSTPVLLAVIALKVWFDLRAHARQHREHDAAAPAAAAVSR